MTRSPTLRRLDLLARLRAAEARAALSELARAAADSRALETQRQRIAALVRETGPATGPTLALDLAAAARLRAALADADRMLDTRRPAAEARAADAGARARAATRRAELGQERLETARTAAAREAERTHPPIDRRRPRG